MLKTLDKLPIDSTNQSVAQYGGEGEEGQTNPWIGRASRNRIEPNCLGWESSNR